MDLKQLENLNYFPEHFRAIKKAEIKLLSEIKEIKLRHFYLDFYIKNKNSKTEYKLLKDARNILIKNGLLISVRDYEKEIGHYSANLSNISNNPLDCFIPKNKIINITYQDAKIPYEKMNYLNPDGWKYNWKANYDYWLENYYPKIKNDL